MESRQRRRLGCATDIHLDAAIDGRQAFYDEVRRAQLDALLVTGDISTSDFVVRHLTELVEATNTIVMFVLGNHDYYGDSIDAVRAMISKAASGHPHLVYLPDGAVDISNGHGSIYLVGVDGWADARTPCFETSTVRLNDYRMIFDLRGYIGAGLEQRLNALGAAEAVRLAGHLAKVPPTCTELYIATHVPPYRGACWHEGTISDDDWAPHFTCVATGEVITEWANRHPEVQVTVLCGHTHGGGVYHVSQAPNVLVFTGEAVYGRPALHMTIEVSWSP